MESLDLTNEKIRTCTVIFTLYVSFTVRTFLCILAVNFEVVSYLNSVDISCSG